jgi:hypothetical protein
MSIRVNEVAAALTGALRLARFDAGGVAYFDLRPEAFMRSFWPAVLVAPFFLLLLVIRHLDNGSAGAFLHDIAIEMLSYAIAWLAFPVVMAFLARPLDCERRYVPYIIVYNWCGAVQNAVYLPIALLGAVGVFSGGTTNFLVLIAILWVVAFSFFVARKVLDVPPPTAFGIVVLDLMLGIVIDSVTNRFVG